jgi:L-amino acid N-acyltransferase YncA
MHIRTASVDDAAAIAEIYNQGIEDRVATYETKRDLPKISRRGFKPSLVVIPPLLRKSTAKSSAGLALDRTGRGNVIAASANFRCTSIATGDVEAWGIYCSLL